jgi:hypothetical protein
MRLCRKALVKLVQVVLASFVSITDMTPKMLDIFHLQGCHLNM